MKQKVALVLSSGGSRGLAQIGVIKELEKNGFEITSVSGSSIGSVIGGLYAMNYLDQYTDWIKSFNKRNIWDLMDFTLSTNGIIKGNKVFNKMKTFIPDIDIEKMNIPFAAIAADIRNEKEVVFTTGSFYEAIRASVSIPSIITPVKYKDTFLVDGGILNPAPIEHVKRNTNDILVVVNLYGNKISIDSKKEKDIYNSVTNITTTTSLGYFSLLKFTTRAMLHKLAKMNIEMHQPDIVINIPYNLADTFDFHKANDLIDFGEKATAKEILKFLNSKK
jgi:NTE family protein